MGVRQRCFSSIVKNDTYNSDLNDNDKVAENIVYSFYHLYFDGVNTITPFVIWSHDTSNTGIPNCNNLKHLQVLVIVFI